MDKDKILEKLSQMPLVELDLKIQEKNLEMRVVITGLAKARDEELVYKFNKRKELLEQGNSFSKVENMLRADEILYNHKRKIIALSANKKKLAIEIEIVKSYYFANKQTGG